MKIVGYSERGIMNALFYGIALDEKKDGLKAMREFLRISGVDNYNNYIDFELYPEFSLSDFGDPDILIKAKQNNGSYTLFFVEAKVSNGNRYCLDKQLSKHKIAINSFEKTHIYDSSQSSNLFFQFKLKDYFFKLKDLFYILKSAEIEKIQEKMNIDPAIKNKGIKIRKIGKNTVVKWLVTNVIKECEEAQFIAILPKTESNFFEIGFIVHCISWQKIRENKILNSYVEETFLANEHDGKSLILNNEKKRKGKKF